MNFSGILDGWVSTKTAHCISFLSITIKIIDNYTQIQKISRLSMFYLYQFDAKTIEKYDLIFIRPLKEEIVESQQRTNGIEILPITLEHVLALENLPAYYKDLFDRLLIAQALVEGVGLVSADLNIAKYNVQVIW